MRSTLALALIVLALLAWQLADHAAAQVPATPTVAPAPTATPLSEKERLEIEKLRAEVDHLNNWLDRYILPIAPGLLAFFAAATAAVIAWRRLGQDRRKYEHDRQADAQRREDEQFRFIVEQFSGGDPAKLAAAVNIQTFFREERLARFRRQAVEILIGNLRVVEQAELVRKALMVALREGIFSLPPEGERLDLRDCNLEGAEWGPKKVGNEEIGIPLQGALMSGQNTSLEKAMLRTANLQGADLSEAKLQRANLTIANLNKAYLAGADLQKAFLLGAALSGARFWGIADIKGADPTESKQLSANLQGADFRGGSQLDDACIAFLRGTNWHEAIWDDEVRQMLEARYGAPAGRATETEAAAEAHEDREA